MKVISNGCHPWTIEELRQFEAAHPIGGQARLAMARLATDSKALAARRRLLETQESAKADTARRIEEARERAQALSRS